MRLLSSADVAAFVAAVKRMKTDGVYDWYVQTHVTFTVMPPAGMGNVPHAGPGFFPWHRQFLVDFEQDLKRAHVALDPANNTADEIDLPYWNWARDQSTDPLVNRLWAVDFMGGSGTPGPTRGRVTTGQFATGVPAGNWPITVQEPLRPDPMDPMFAGAPVDFLQRGVGLVGGVGSPPGLTHTRESVNDPPNPLGPPGSTIPRPYDASDWDEAVAAADGFRNLSEGFVGTQIPGLHNRVHVYVWGSMITMASPNDPLFFLHHANVDRLWVLWQLKFASRNQYPARLAAPAPTLTAALAAGGTLAPGQYGYEVAAVVAGGNHTTRSTERVVTVAAGTRRVNLSWTAVAGATDYLVYRRTPTVGYEHFTTVPGGTTAFPDTGAAVAAPPAAPRPVAQPRLAHAFDDPMPPWDGRPDTRPAPYSRGTMPVVRPRNALNHRGMGYRYRDVAPNIVIGP